MLNSTAPDFSLTASTGQQISLKDLKGSFVVLIFYPANDTPVCDRQLKEASMNICDFLAMGTRVFGVNTASVAKQKDYCTRKKLEYPILSDPGGKVAKAYKAHMIWLPFNNRTVVVVDPQGVICYYQRGAPPAEQILEAIKKRKTELETGAA
jgi:peroxiredoxin Q/BCP